MKKSLLGRIHMYYSLLFTFLFISCTETITDPSFGGQIVLKYVEAESSKPVAQMYKRAGDRWIAILWSIEKVEKGFQLQQYRTEWAKVERGVITVEEYFEEYDQYEGGLALTAKHVKEANRILGVELYTLDDRKDRRKSFDIFTTYCSVYNSSYESLEAIRILRPKADSSYKLEFTSQLASYIKGK